METLYQKEAKYSKATIYIHPIKLNCEGDKLLEDFSNIFKRSIENIKKKNQISTL